MSILDGLGLNAQQQAAVTASGDLVVTAGPGSGKTLTLVGRYLWLLERGLAPGAVVAVTFTQKAGRELRNRVRSVIRRHLETLDDPTRRSAWEQRYAELDAAPIGTIHSLCARILRLHPAEAGLDPEFEVLDEGRALAFKAQALEEALAWAANEGRASRLFGLFDERELRGMLQVLLDLPLAAQEAFGAAGQDALGHWQHILKAWLEQRFDHHSWQEAMAVLSGVRARTGSDKLEENRLALLQTWGEVRSALARTDWETVLTGLPEMRRCMTPHLGSGGNWLDGQLQDARRAMTHLRRLYEHSLAGFLGRRELSAGLDERVGAAVPALRSTFERAMQVYQGLKDGALDFDDLEWRAVELLERRGDVLEYWRRRVQALLVDEFQDTNHRQDRLVAVLAPVGGGRLFLVGDDQQSIYRFRGADVTVFRRRVKDLQGRGPSQRLRLDLTYRAHRSLVELLNELLPAALTDERATHRDYAVPFHPLRAHRQEPAPWAGQPYLELHLGVGANADEARPRSAAALTHRLWQLHQAGLGWEEVALLFRSSTNFSVWEDALDSAGIPFVTVAGRGFYHRPEVRDVLNALVALSDPGDDLAMAGVLRSPVVGLSDEAVYRLRWGPGTERPRALWAALAAGAEPLEGEDRERALRALRVLRGLQGVAGRVPVADLIRLYLDATHYPALLNLNPQTARAGRNLEKLIQDALDSGLVGVASFLQYVETLRDVGVREGEAPAEASDSVQLMTAHKAKGLEFPLVILGDAGQRRWAASPTIVHPRWGVVPRLQEGDRLSAFYRWAAYQDDDQQWEEEKRLLYVAATRAREKLLVSGHVRIWPSGGLQLDGWLGMLGPALKLDGVLLGGRELEEGRLELALPGWEERVGCVLHEAVRPAVPGYTVQAGLAEPVPEALPLAEPLRLGPAERPDAKEVDRHPPRRTWRIVPPTERVRAPRWVLGAAVHHALRQGLWSVMTEFTRLMAPAIRNLGVVDEGELRGVVREAGNLLERLAGHPVRAEIEGAPARHHEVPYTYPTAEGVDFGIIDLLYRSQRGWEVLEFKTDRLASEEELERVLQERDYLEQARRYGRALTGLLGQAPRVRLCFLDFRGGIRLEEVV